MKLDEAGRLIVLLVVWSQRPEGSSGPSLLEILS